MTKEQEAQLERELAAARAELHVERRRRGATEQAQAGLERALGAERRQRLAAEQDANELRARLRELERTLEHATASDDRPPEVLDADDRGLARSLERLSRDLQKFPQPELTDPWEPGTNARFDSVAAVIAWLRHEEAYELAAAAGLPSQQRSTPAVEIKTQEMLTALADAIAGTRHPRQIRQLDDENAGKP